jgi:cyclophilin family peptidyl-prolyl cis-trans isomerase/Flp pilus assembly protein TadD
MAQRRAERLVSGGACPSSCPGLGILMRPLIRCAALALLPALLAGCPKLGAPAGATGAPAPGALGWVKHSENDPGFCVSAVSAAGPLAEAPAIRAAVDGPALLAALQAVQSDHPAARAAQAAVAWTAGDLVGTRNLLRDLVNAWPEDACLHAGLSRAYAELGATKLARSHAEEAARLDPTAPDIGYLLGAIQYAMSEPDLAATTWRAVLQHSPDHAATNTHLGVLYLQRGDNMMAIPHLERALAAGRAVEGPIARAWLGVGELGPYLQLASKNGAPMGDGGAVGRSDQPLVRFQELLGLGPKGEVWAEVQTSLGPLRCELLWREAPVTVANFVGLARGTQPWTDPRTAQPGVGALYAGTTFHRIIPDFMVQSGDPVGDGTGGPGYQFSDELHSGRTFDRGGLLAMANSGPGTNGSQWFITEVPVEHLNGKHTIFGVCDAETLERVRVLARQPRGAMDKPSAEIRVEQILISGR